jgi:hypothetical protein
MPTHIDLASRLSFGDADRVTLIRFWQELANMDKALQPGSKLYKLIWINA